MHSIKVRSGRSKDLPQLNQLMYQLHHYHHISASDDIKTASEISEQKSISTYIDDPDCLVYVAECEGRIVGFITGHFCELVSVVSKSIFMGSVDELYVLEAFRNQSVAKQLMEKLEITFKEYGVKKVFVEVWDFNSVARQFYKQSGFSDQIHWLCKRVSD